MANITKIRVRRNGVQTEILALVKHPMNAGLTEPPDADKAAPARIIETVTFRLNNRVVAVADLGPNVDANPLTGISVSDAKPGDTVSVTWADSGGGTGGAETTVT